VLIIASFAAANAVALGAMAKVQAENREIVTNALFSIEDVGRLVRDLDRLKLLVDEHIFERESADMDRIEQSIEAIEADYDRTTGAYEPLVSFDGERDVWDQLKVVVAQLRIDIVEVIAVSRRNQDVEARAKMAAMADRYEAVTQLADRLIAINRNAAEEASEHVRVHQHQEMIFLGVLTLICATAAVVAGTYVTRIITRLSADLARSAALLEARNRELDAFASRVAHDLRGPLTTVGLSASRLARSAPLDERAHATMRRGIARMESIIDDLLTLSRVEAAAPEGSCDPARVAAIVAEELAPEVEANGGALRLDVDPAEVACPEGLLRQALWNLAENALKYRRSDVPVAIEIRGRKIGEQYELRVEDNGSGMSHKVASRAFEPFFRGDNAGVSPGTGLGLSIVRRVVEASSGTIAIDSEVGSGTTFVLTLPSAQSTKGAREIGPHSGRPRPARS
jgi:signal transduction histidine kinase